MARRSAPASRIRLTVLQYVDRRRSSPCSPSSFWVLQVVQHAKFEEMAENNHQRTLALRAPRGMVFDRDGQVLVENRHSYSISIVREHTKDLNRTIRLLAAVLGIDEAAVRADRRPPPARADATGRSRSCRTRRWRRSPRSRARRLDFELPDVVVEQVPTRRYPGDDGGASVRLRRRGERRAGRRRRQR